jgi:hypothetical protein
LVARSHRYFPDHYTASRNHQESASSFYSQRLDEVGFDDWLEIDPTDADLLDPARIIMLQLSPGDVLLWDSRTVHCSYPPDPSQPECAAGGESGLVRAATLVSMLPQDVAAPTDGAVLARYQSTRTMRTLTHWVNKAAPLGDERADQASLEQFRVSAIKEWEERHGKQVLLSWEDLSEDQRSLVVGDRVDLAL